MSFILSYLYFFFFFFQAEDGIRDLIVTGVQTCALPISSDPHHGARHGLGLDRSIPRQRPHERPGDERAEYSGHTLDGAGLGPRADEPLWPGDVDAFEPQAAYHLFRLALHPAVENPRPRGR